MSTPNDPRSLEANSARSTARLIAIANQKGGSGKTTTAVCLAAALGELGRRVLVVDLDSQANATRWLGGDPAAAGMYEVLTDGAELPGVIQAGAAGVRLAPSSPFMVGVERALAGDPAPQFILQAAFRQLDAGAFDYVLMDCPAALGTVTINALTAAAGVLVPVQTKVLALEGLAQLTGTIRTVKERLNPQLEITGILACQYDSRTRLAADVLESLRRTFPETLLETVIRENVRIAEAPSFRQPITEYDPRSTGAEDYRALAREIEGQARPESNS